MPMKFAEFLNELRRLHCIEGWDVEGLSEERQAAFVRNPVQFLLRADDETKRQIWLAMERDREKWKEYAKPFLMRPLSAEDPPSSQS